MTIVLTMDQRASRRNPDAVEAWAERLNGDFRDALALPFVRTVGDEMQAVLDDPGALAEIVARSLLDGRWSIGIGVGEADPLGEDARSSAGPAFWAAREAVTRAKKRTAPQPVAVEGGPQSVAADLEACLSALAFIVLRRTEPQQEAVALLREGSSRARIAERLGISESAVSQRLRGAGAEEEAGLRRLAASIAGGAG
jgi:hypothetical protein